MILVMIGKTLKGVSVVIPNDDRNDRAEHLSPSGGMGGESPLYP